MELTRTDRKHILVIAEEWDQLAGYRADQIDRGVDKSFSELLAPEIISSIRRGSRVLDFGCGTGSLTEQIADIAGEVCAIDASRNSIELAGIRHSRPNITYEHSTVEKYRDRDGLKFDHIVSNMVLMDVPELGAALDSAHSLCRPSGQFDATITHPFFWPRYWGYDKEEWFNYMDEIFIEAPFRIANEILPLVSTHIHRPIGLYVSYLYDAGFVDVRLKELTLGSPERFPRFLRLSANAR